MIEEEELHLTLKKEETLAVEQPSPRPSKEPPVRVPLPAGPGPQPEWRPVHEVLHAKLSCEQQTEGHFISKTPYLPPRWDQNKPAALVALPESTPRVKDPIEGPAARVGKVLPMCKQADGLAASPDKDDHGVPRKEAGQGPAHMAAYCQAGQGVMSPLAKKKLLSFTSALQPPHPPTSGSDRDKERRKGEEEVSGQRLDTPEVAPVFRPSVIQHAQSSRPQQGAGSGSGAELSDSYGCRASRHLQPVNPPWQPYLPHGRTQDPVDTPGEKLLTGPSAQSRGYAGDHYSSPHLHSLYRQTESCLGQERMSGYGQERDGGRGFVCGTLEQEGLVYRSHYGDKAPAHGDGREGEDEPRNLSVSKPLSQRVASFSKPPFCSLPYSIVHPGLDSHPKACRVPPMTKQSPAESSSPDTPLGSPVRPGKRSLADPESDDVPERKVRVVTPIHPACAIRRGDPEELKPAEPAHAVHLNNRLPEGHSTTTYPPPHTGPLYAGMYPPGSLVSGAQDGLQQHPGLQYLKSQSAVSPLVPPLAFHSMLLHRQLLASSPSPHHFYRHPGGAALYGDLLHHLYPLSTLPPPQLSSVHPSTRL